MKQRVAVIGAGYFAQHQLRAWQDLGVELVALCDPDTAKAKALAERFGVGQVFADCATMLREAAPSLLDIVTPPATHAQLVAMSLEHRIPTICQKPFCGDIEQAQTLVAKAQSLGVPLVIHENFRFMPWFRECKRLLNSGFVGQPHGITFRLRPGDGQGPRAYLDRQPYFQTMAQLLIRETGGHYVDTFRYLMGEVVSVQAHLRRINPVIAGEDAALVIFEFENASTGLLDGNRLNDHPAADARRTMGEMWLEGAAGVLRLDGDARLWWKPHHGTEVEHLYDQGDDTAFGGACRLLQAHVLKHLAEGTPLENSGPDYLRNLRVQAAIYHAHATGARVDMATFPSPLV